MMITSKLRKKLTFLNGALFSRHLVVTWMRAVVCAGARLPAFWGSGAAGHRGLKHLMATVTCQLLKACGKDRKRLVGIKKVEQMG